MALFKRKRPTDRGGGFPRRVNDPAQIIAMMERFGRYEYDSNSDANPSTIWPDTQAPFQEVARNDPQEFLESLATAVVPVGGWAAYGASHTIQNLVPDTHRSDPSFIAIMDAAIAFLRQNRVPPSRITGFERDHWVASGASMSDWLPGRPGPSADDSPIADLAPGESRQLAQLTSDPDSNVIFAQHSEQGRYVAIVDAKWNDEDPRRVQNEWLAADSLRELYELVGRSLGAPTYRYDRQLEPFFPLPPSAI